jgi:hypothetical protein
MQLHMINNMNFIPYYPRIIRLRIDMFKIYIYSLEENNKIFMNMCYLEYFIIKKLHFYYFESRKK